MLASLTKAVMIRVADRLACEAWSAALSSARFCQPWTPRPLAAGFDTIAVKCKRCGSLLEVDQCALKPEMEIMFMQPVELLNGKPCLKATGREHRADIIKVDVGIPVP